MNNSIAQFLETSLNGNLKAFQLFSDYSKNKDIDSFIEKVDAQSVRMCEQIDYVDDVERLISKSFIFDDNSVVCFNTLTLRVSLLSNTSELPDLLDEWGDSANE